MHLILAWHFAQFTQVELVVLLTQVRQGKPDGTNDKESKHTVDESKRTEPLVLITLPFRRTRGAR